MAVNPRREEFLTVKDFARCLKVHPQTVRRWLRDGKIKNYLQYGHYGHYRIHRVIRHGKPS
jgi:excisionase family DNA binding protein